MFVGHGLTVPRYKLYELDNGLPIMVEVLNNGLAIKGEIYDLEGETLGLIDLYERNAGYDRHPIKLQNFNEPVESYLYLKHFDPKSPFVMDCGQEWGVESLNSKRE